MAAVVPRLRCVAPRPRAAKPHAAVFPRRCYITPVSCRSLKPAPSDMLFNISINRASWNDQIPVKLLSGQRAVSILAQSWELWCLYVKWCQKYKRKRRSMLQSGLRLEKQDAVRGFSWIWFVRDRTETGDGQKNQWHKFALQELVSVKCSAWNSLFFLSQWWHHI